MVGFLELIALSSFMGGGLPPATLARYFSQHPWDVAKRGPMVVLDPQSVRPILNEGARLADYGRQEFSAGSLTVIAPTEMVLIDSQLKEPPNFFDGLDRKDKIVYLMSILDSDQWKIASSSGIGLADLRGEQREVFQSILPSVFTYENYRLGHDGDLATPAGEPKEITLGEQEKSEVRIHFAKYIYLGVEIGGYSGISSGVSPQNTDLKKAGSPVLIRKDEAVEDRSFLFGVQIRRVVPNKLKPSDLNYSSTSLDAPIELAGIKTVGEACKAASAVTGLRILADIRIATRPITGYGVIARTGDVLRALALTVTGTYRRVGDLMLLTSDVEGIGAKRQKIAAWRADVEYQVWLRSKDWLAAIGSSGGARNVHVAEDSLLQPNDAMTKFLDKDRDSPKSLTMPVSDLSPEWRALLQRSAKQFDPGHPMVANVVEPIEQMDWNFVTPDGKQLERELGGASPKVVAQALTGRPYHVSNSEVRPISLPKSSSSAFIYKTEDPTAAAAMLPVVKSHGFEEYWIQTQQQECLSKLIEAAKVLKVKIRLVIEPWSATPGIQSSALDCAITGEKSAEALVHHDGTSMWRDGVCVLGVAPQVASNLIEPVCADREALWQRIVRLSSTPGLDGTVLCQTEPNGYEPSAGSTLFQDSLRLDLGYSVEMRRQFLAENIVDPVDFVDTRLILGKVDLTLPFFVPNEQQWGSGTVESIQPGGYFPKWLQYRSELNRKSITDLANQIRGPVYFQPRKANQDMPIENGYSLVPWRVGEELPTSTVLGFEEQSLVGGRSDAYWVWEFGYPLEPPVASRIFDKLTRHLKKVNGSIAIDMRSVPEDQIPQLLDKWFVVGA